MPKVAHLFVKDMVAGNDARSRVVKNALRVYMEGPSSVLLMGVERDVLRQNAPKVQGVEQVSVSDMVVVSVASLKAVGRVHRDGLISAKLMVAASGVCSDSQVQLLGPKGLHVTGLLGGKVVYVRHTVASFKIMQVIVGFLSSHTMEAIMCTFLNLRK